MTITKRLLVFRHKLTSATACERYPDRCVLFAPSHIDDLCFVPDALSTLSQVTSVIVLLAPLPHAVGFECCLSDSHFDTTGHAVTVSVCLFFPISSALCTSDPRTVNPIFNGNYQYTSTEIP